MMAQSELEELCQKLNEKLHRSDITPEFIHNVMRSHMNGHPQHERVSIKPYVRQKLREAAARDGLRPSLHAVGDAPLYVARR